MSSGARLVKLLSEKNLTCATAESCTGGGVGAAITAQAGSSAVYLGGVVSYDNCVKTGLLGVPEEVIQNKGAVSEECAAAMAEGARKLIGADLAVSVTGIAGPGGGSAEKPVGTVWFSVASGELPVCECRRFPGDRAAVRAAAVEHALKMLLSAAESKKKNE